MSHYIKTFAAVAVLALAAAGMSYAASMLQLHNGENMRIGKVLCVVRGGGVTCSSGHHNVIASTTKDGVALMVHGKVKYVCVNSGVCAKP